MMKNADKISKIMVIFKS